MLESLYPPPNACCAPVYIPFQEVGMVSAARVLWNIALGPSPHLQGPGPPRHLQTWTQKLCVMPSETFCKSCGVPSGSG